MQNHHKIAQETRPREPADKTAAGQARLKREGVKEVEDIAAPRQRAALKTLTLGV